MEQQKIKLEEGQKLEVVSLKDTLLLENKKEVLYVNHVAGKEIKNLELEQEARKALANYKKQKKKRLK